MSGLSIASLSAAYGSTEVLRELSLDVPEGSLTAILGPSGSGKTTLLRVIAGFERPTAGTVTLDDVVLNGPRKHVAAERRGLGYVAQDGALFPHLTVARNVAFGLPRSADRSRRVVELLELVGLGAFGGRFPHELSGGQQQRVALARALALKPRVVLLDEPFAALDASLRNDVRRDVARILRDAGTTTVLVTHDQDEALSMADQVAVLRSGRMVQVGSPAELYQRPVDPELAQFLGAANLLPGVAEPGGIRTSLGLHPGGSFEIGCPVRVLIRPEQLQVAAGTDAVITATEYHGHEVLLTLDSGLTALTRPERHLVVDAKVDLTVFGTVHAWPTSLPS